MTTENLSTERVKIMKSLHLRWIIKFVKILRSVDEPALEGTSLSLLTARRHKQNNQPQAHDPPVNGIKPAPRSHMLTNDM
jgi:hypothetical protein